MGLKHPVQSPTRAASKHDPIQPAWLVHVMKHHCVYSYLVVRYAEGNKVATSVGFYYCANAGGRLVGTPTLAFTGPPSQFL